MHIDHNVSNISADGSDVKSGGGGGDDGDDS
jgi:hypothetical protein